MLSLCWENPAPRGAPPARLPTPSSPWPCRSSDPVPSWGPHPIAAMALAYQRPPNSPAPGASVMTSHPALGPPAVGKGPPLRPISQLLPKGPGQAALQPGTVSPKAREHARGAGPLTPFPSPPAVSLGGTRCSRKQRSVLSQGGRPPTLERNLRGREGRILGLCEQMSRAQK